MQEDTFTLVSTLLWSATAYIQEPDPHALQSVLMAIYDLVHMRLPDEVGEDIEAISDRLHGDEEDTKDAVFLSEIFDEERRVFRKITQYLDKEGLLFRIQRNLDRIGIEG